MHALIPIIDASVKLGMHQRKGLHLEKREDFQTVIQF